MPQSGNLSDVRQVHESGFVSIACDKSGKNKSQFVTCGTEGSIYIWNTSTFTEKSAPDVKNVCENTHSCISWRDDHIFLGGTVGDLISGIDKKIIGRADFSNPDELTTMINFPLDPLCVDCSEHHLVAGCSDFTVRMCELAKPEDVKRIEVDGEVLSVQIDPAGEVFAASVTSGTLYICTLAGETIATIPKAFEEFGSIEFDKPRVELKWTRDGRFLLVPLKGRVGFVSKDGWKISSEALIMEGCGQDSFSCSAISSDGEWFAASTTSNKIGIWRMNDRTLVNSHTYTRAARGRSVVSGIAFSPFDSDSLIIVDTNEGMSLWSEAITKMAKNGPGPGSVARSQKPKKKIVVEDEDDEEQSEGEADTLENMILDREAEELSTADDDSRISADIGAIKRKFGTFDVPTLDDFGFGATAGMSRDPYGAGASASASSVPQAVTTVVEYDPPAIPSQFVSGASADQIHVSTRYLKYNAYGYVFWKKNEDGNSSIDIAFYDSSVSSDIAIDNKNGYNLADISNKAVALASKASDSNDESEMLVINLSLMDPSESKRWVTSFPAKDGAMDVMVSDAHVAVLTALRNVRIFSLTGTQLLVLSHPGPILTAASFANKVAIASVTCSEFYEEVNGEKQKKAQYQYGVMIYDTNPRTWYTTESHPRSLQIPVTPKKTVIWMGFTNNGALAVMDSAYVLRILTPSGIWIPVFDGSPHLQSKLDSIWPMAISGGEQGIVRYYYSKNSKHPPSEDVGRSLSEIWKLPMCQQESEKSALEETLILNELQQAMAVNDAYSMNILQKTHLQTIAKLFALACKGERETRALEFAQLVTSVKSMQILANYAASAKRMVLAEKISAAGRELLNENEFDGYTSRPSAAISSDPLTPKEVLHKHRVNRHSVPKPPADLPPELEEEIDQENDSPQDEAMEQDSLRSEFTQIPVQTFRMNPFKRATESPLNTSSGSVFDRLEESVTNPRKRMREEEASQKSTPSIKQSKLVFGPKSTTGKSGTTPFALWLEENEKKMKEMFSGDISDFEKFCASQYRLLPAAQKKEWKAKADALTS